MISIDRVCIMENMLSLENEDSEIPKSQHCFRSNDNSKKIYSLIPDLITGWKPKNIKIPSPVLIKYKSPLVTQLLEYYQDELQRIIYIGPRYTNSLMFHQHISHEYILKFGLTTEDIPNYLQKQLKSEDLELKGHRVFQGMNPSLKSSSQFEFDSHFESGNLDLVIQVSENQFNLFLRPDTNTCGHMQWFYFVVKNKQKGKIKLNICNNRKAKTLYSRGMKPYVLSKHSKEAKGGTWQQSGENLSYSRLILQEQALQKYIDQKVYRVHNLENNYSLSFQYTFEYENDEVSFAYSPPYTFSHLKDMILDLKKKYNCFETIITEQKFCTSLSGIDIPLLTITDSTVNEDKICLLSIGRIHPGQSNGSYVAEGFLKYILSEEAREMRRHVVFKVIPMINPDGVIFGNYRTSLSGKDLNRMFRTKNVELLPEVTELKSFVKKLKYENKYKVTYFLDFHGHSLKKNVFFYGPEYDIWSIKYDKAKILPKILSLRTQLFRMKSCLFKVASVKKSTARAFMLAYIPYCYTVESSLGIYKDHQNHDHPFTISKWSQVGFKIGESFTDIIAQLVKCETNARKRKQKRVKKNENSLMNTLKQNEEVAIDQKIKQPQISNLSSKSYLNPIRHLKKRTIQLPKQADEKEINPIQEEECESDRFSEGNSDCQSVDNDLPKAEYERLKEKIVNMIDTFQALMVGFKKESARMLPKEKKLYKISKVRENSCKKTMEQMLMVPSLKHRILKMNLSEKKISILNSLQNIDSPCPKKISKQ